MVNTPLVSERQKSLQLMSYCNRDRLLYGKILKLMTPIGAEAPVLTYRNVRCLVYLIANQHAEWMTRCHTPDQDCGSNYRKKIMKYNLLVKNLN